MEECILELPEASDVDGEADTDDRTKRGNCCDKNAKRGVNLDVSVHKLVLVKSGLSICQKIYSKKLSYPGIGCTGSNRTNDVTSFYL